MPSTDQKNIRYEHDLVTVLVDRLNVQGYRVRTEVPNLGQSVDVVATKGRWVTAIEAKMSNWRRALEQCATHEATADFVCVAIATSAVSPFLVEVSRSRGYGIIHIEPRSHEFTWVLRPKVNKRIWKPQRKQFSSYMRRIDVHD